MKHKDINLLAKSILDVVMGEIEAEKKSEKNPIAVALGQLSGKLAGKAKSGSLTPERRAEIARDTTAKGGVKNNYIYITV